MGQIKESTAFHDGQHNHKSNFTKNDNIKHFLKIVHIKYISQHFQNTFSYSSYLSNKCYYYSHFKDKKLRHRDVNN